MGCGKITKVGKRDWEHKNDGTVEISNDMARVALREVKSEQRLKEVGI